ncbi:hypothetical protein MASR1M32_22160 [Rhodobacter sp.]
MGRADPVVPGDGLSLWRHIMADWQSCPQRLPVPDRKGATTGRRDFARPRSQLCPRSQERPMQSADFVATLFDGRANPAKVTVAFTMALNALQKGTAPWCS